MQMCVDDAVLMSSYLTDSSSPLLLLKPFAKGGIVAADVLELPAPEEFRLSLFGNRNGNEPLTPVYSDDRGRLLFGDVELDWNAYVPPLTLLEFARPELAENIFSLLPGADFKGDALFATKCWERNSPVFALFCNPPVLVVDLDPGSFELLGFSDLADSGVEKGGLECGLDKACGCLATSRSVKKLVFNPEPLFGHLLKKDGLLFVKPVELKRKCLGYYHTYNLYNCY